jgi:MoaD family protein
MQVNFFATLRAEVGRKAVELPLPEGTTVLALAQEIAQRWPGLADQMIDDEGRISRRVHFMIGGRNVRWLPEGDETKLCATDVVEVFPPTAGG